MGWQGLSVNVTAFKVSKQDPTMIGFCEKFNSSKKYRGKESVRHARDIEIIADNGERDCYLCSEHTDEDNMNVLCFGPTKLAHVLDFTHDPDEGIIERYQLEELDQGLCQIFGNIDGDDDDVLYFGFVEFENLQTTFFKNANLTIDHDELKICLKTKRCRETLLFKFNDNIKLYIGDIDWNWWKPDCSCEGGHSSPSDYDDI